jgi:hypothetical protein
MFKTPWSEKSLRQKAASIGIIIGIFFGCAVIAYAVSNYITHGSFTISNTRGYTFTIDLSGSVPGIAVVPGSEQSVNTSIENTGTEKMYVFVRFDVGTTSNDAPIYSFTTSGWSAVDTGNTGELLFVYGSESTPTAVYPGDTASLSGTLTVVATGADFVGLTDNDFAVTVTGCAVGGPESSGTASALYAEYLSLGGQ